MKVVTIGSATIDVIALVANDAIERMTMHNSTASFLLLEQGKKVDAGSVSTHIGGGAVNAAVALRRLEMEAEVLVKIGRDLNGEKVLELCDEAGLGTRMILRTQEAGTGTSVMVASHDRNVSIFTFRGANTLMRPEEIERFDFSGADLVYLSNLSAGTRDCLPLLMEKARSAGAFIAMNPGILQLTEQPDRLLEYLPQIDLLAINRREAGSFSPHIFALAKRAGAPVSGIRGSLPESMNRDLVAGGFKMPLIDFFKTLLDYGTRHIAVTDGTDGSFVADSAGVYFCPSLKCEVSGTAGAGDAFAATLSGFIAAREKISFAIQAASANAASVVGHMDTQTGLLTRAELEKRLEAQTEQLPVSFWEWEK